MWCAVQVKGGNEAKTEAFVSEFLPKSLNARCFHLTRNRRKKYGGKWQTVRENLLPGYVFIDTDQPDAVYRELKKTPNRKLLFSNEEFVTTLAKRETDFMERISDEGGEIGISRICIAEGGEIRYLSGPLADISHMVKKINLHQRIAEIETSFMGEKHVLYLGIEITE